MGICCFATSKERTRKTYLQPDFGGWTLTAPRTEVGANEPNFCKITYFLMITTLNYKLSCHIFETQAQRLRLRGFKLWSRGVSYWILPWLSNMSLAVVWCDSEAAEAFSIYLTLYTVHGESDLPSLRSKKIRRSTVKHRCGSLLPSNFVPGLNVNVHTLTEYCHCTASKQYFCM